MFAKLFKNYTKNQIKEISTGITDAIVKFDPEGASEAEIESMEENFDEVNIEFSKVQQEWKKEQKEADDIIALRDKRIATAELLQTQLAADPDNAQIGAALDQLVTALEGMQDDIDREVMEAADAKEVMEELEETVNLYASKLKTARSDMKKAMNTMKKANQQKERAAEKAERAARLNGLRSSGSAMSSALASMNKQAEEAKAETEALKRKSALLGKSEVEENDVIAQAMAAVSGDAPKPTSVADRLAALKK